MIIVTGAAGFIGSNLIKGLNAKGHDNILAVDELTDGHKFQNLAAVSCMDYLDCEDFLTQIQNRTAFPEKITAIFHEGACSVTTEWNGRYMMRNNYEYSKQLLHYCLDHKIPFIYASSAAVYGASEQFNDRADRQNPINVYGYSKWQFDCYVLRQNIQSQVVGLRYFNVYGPHEQHKGSMASVAFHFMNQLNAGDEVKLFSGYGGYGDGEQLRDFIFVDDVVKVNLWFLQNSHRPQARGIFNVGTGKARTFNDIANTLIRLKGRGKICYVPFPQHLKGAYQSYTQADIASLRAVGYDQPFTSLEAGLESYYRYFHGSEKLVTA
ncbi:MAG: ADP-glyceromanno-heptose 6-epimerase [Proteobacteria bacterium]|nr:ADP-glyceromanno-heptose 6-epimerase [Pseudomonadota bacterium]